MLEIKENLNGKRLLLAVSGGLDSVCLLHFFKENFETLGISALAVAHIDHTLRGDESKKDAEFVKELCKKWNVDFYFKSLEGKLPIGNNLESRARELRYLALHKFKRSGNFDFLLTAHHQNDQAETVFMRLARGTSISGLRAIRKIRHDGVYRPFLEISREELQNYANENQLSWREDSSNQNTNFRRNKIRHQLFPIFEKEIPEFSKQLQTLSSLAEKAYNKIVLICSNEFEPLILPKEKWPFPYEFCPYKETICFKLSELEKKIKAPGNAELFRIWLSEKGFTFSLGAKGNILFPLPKRRLLFKNILVEKSGNALWFFKMDSFLTPDNLYLYNASADSKTKWRFRMDGDFYITKSLEGKRRKWVKWLQEHQIPLAVRDFLPLLSEGSKIIRIGKPEEFEIMFANKKGIYGKS